MGDLRYLPSCLMFDNKLTKDKCLRSNTSRTSTELCAKIGLEKYAVNPDFAILRYFVT